MRSILFAMKHLFRNAVFPAFLVLTIALPALAGLAAQHALLPPAAVYAEDPSDPDTARFVKCLSEAGFRVAESREELEYGVSMEHFDAGIVVPADFSRRLRDQDVREIFTMVVSQSTSLDALWKEHAGAALFNVYAPYLTYDVISDLPISEEAFFKAYYGLVDGDPLFIFELETLDGRKPRTGNIRAKSFFLGLLSILIFLSSFFGIAMPVLAESRRLTGRLPKKRVFVSFTLPSFLARLGFLLLAAVLACLVSNHADSILPALLSTVAMALVSLLPWISRPGNWQVILGAFIVLFSLALCPIFIDLSLFFKPVSVIRNLLPPYWLWLFGGANV